MADIRLVQIILEVWGAVFVFICALIIFWGRESEPYRSKLLLNMLFLDTILLCSDALALGFRGNGSICGYYMVRITNYIVFVCAPLLVLQVGKFCSEVIRSNGGAANPIWGRAIFTVCVLDIAIISLSQITGYIYFFDADNIYHRNDGYAIIALLSFLLLGLLAGLILRYRQYMSQKEAASLLVYVCLPMISNGIQLLYYGISFNNIAISVSLMMVFVSNETEKSRRLVNQEQAIAEQKIQISLKDKELAEKQNQIAISQMQPHFLFNVLGSIEQLCKQNPAVAADATHHFARYLRRNINALSTTDPVSFQTELEHIRTYVWLEQMRFGEDLVFREDISVSEFKVPTLSIQPLVENAVKHGMMGMKDGVLTVLLQTIEQADGYQIIVQDNGSGFEPSLLNRMDSGHIGLSNVKERIELMAQGTMQIHSKVGEGTTVIVMIPKGGIA